MNFFYLKVLSLILFSFTSLSLSAQSLVINEVDADTPGTDVQEFVELYDGGVGNTSLDGYVLVLFNGGSTTSPSDISYYALDLDSYTTDENGFFVIGNSAVANVDIITSNGFMQNGPDAVALYQANEADFPNGTSATATGIVDAIVYETNDADATGLINTLTPGQSQIDEASNGDQSNHSIARATDGAGGPLVTSSYVAQTPTPGTSNSAPPATVVSFEAASATAFENDGTVTLTLSITNPSTDNATTVEVNLIAGDAADLNNYATQTVTFPAGSTDPQTVGVTITDDELEEETETFTFTLQNVSGGISPAVVNETFELTLLDNEYSAYYDGVAGLTGNELKQKLHEIIREHTVYPYTSSSTDVWDILRDADEDPANADNVLLLYSGRSIPKSSQDPGANGDYWNREHVWPKSHGFPYSEDTAYTDTHHLRAAARDVNTMRSNKDFDDGGAEYTSTYGGEISYYDGDSWEPRDAVKGDVARMILYMATRYEGSYDLELVEYTNTPNEPILGKLTTLLAWHLEDPVSQEEKDRNEVIFGYQGNRNPFIDYPEFVNLIYDNLVEEVEEPLVAGDTLFVDNFDNCETTIANWTAYSVASTNNFECSTYGMEGSNGVQMNGYNEDVQSIDWLISQPFDFSAYDFPTFVFNTRTKYGDHKVQLMVSTNYTSGDPSAADWTELAISLPDNNSDVWTESGVDLSAYKTANVTLAFKYVSTQDPARWTFDNFLVVAATEQYVDPNAVTTGGSGDGTGDGTSDNLVDGDVVFEDNFNDCETTIANWTAYSVASANNFECTAYGIGGTNGVQMNGYNEDEPSIDWLISQPFDFSAYDYPTFVFNTRTRYGDHKVQLMVSTNYTSGDPSAADWTELAISLPDNDTDVWTESGVDLSAYNTANVTLAFKYVSTGDPARWTFDDFSIVAATEQYVDPNAVTTGNSGDGTGGDGTEEPVLGADEVVAVKFEMYPNPASTELTVSGGSAEVERLTFYDLSGKLVKAFTFRGQQEVTVDVSGLKSGLYLLKVQTSEGVTTKRMSKN